MSLPPADRPKKNPLRKTAEPQLPPASRSRAAHRLIPAAASGRFALPRCVACGSFCWPVPEACPSCLGADLPISDAPRGARLLSWTTAELPALPYFRDRAPWRIGLATLDCGPTALLHLHPACQSGDSLTLSLMLDRAGQAVLHAAPAEGADMTADPQWQEMTADPSGRRVLITDARHLAALPLAKALQSAGASKIYLGLGEAWKPLPTRARLEGLAGCEIVPLDLTSDRSVEDLARDIGARIEILVNTADLPRPGSLLAPATQSHARDMLENTVFALMRLARNFAPVLAARGMDGPRGAAAWVNLLSVFGRVPHADFPGYGAAHAAALALLPPLRATLRSGGVRLVTALTGPTDIDWFQRFPRPKVSGDAIADAVVAGLRGGLEELVIGDLAREWLARQASNPRALERELSHGGL